MTDFTGLPEYIEARKAARNKLFNVYNIEDPDRVLDTFAEAIAERARRDERERIQSEMFGYFKSSNSIPIDRVFWSKDKISSIIGESDESGQ